VGASVAASCLIFFDSFVGGIDRVLIFAVPFSVLVALFGLITLPVGAVRSALQTSTRTLAWLGAGLVGLGVVCFLVVDKIQFGFDDATIVFALAITATPLVVGVVFLIRSLRAGYARATK
jgi:hypothetical protein